MALETLFLHYNGSILLAAAVGVSVTVRERIGTSQRVRVTERRMAGSATQKRRERERE